MSKINIKFALLLMLCFLAWLFIFPKSSSAAYQDAIINEIMWMGSSVSTADEWIELRNMTSRAIDFNHTPWSIYKNDSLMLVVDEGVLEADGYFLISNNSESHMFSGGESILDVAPDLVDTNVSLSNSSAQYKLYDGSNSSASLIDIADDGSGVPLAGENESVKKSMERNDNPGDGTIKANWHSCYKAKNIDDEIYNCATPGAENSQPPPPVVYSHDIRINELLPNPSGDESNNEFVELYNYGDDEIDLTGWKIKDKSGEFELSGEVEPEGFAVFYDTVTLNNDGDQIDLFDPNGEVVSSVSYGKAEESESYSWNGEEWKWSPLPTPGSENKFTEDIDYPDKLFISELLPNPSDSPEKDFEYVEIFNSEEETVDLSGWKLKDKSSSYTLAGIVGPKEFIIFYDTVSLNNGGDEIKLVNPLDKVVHTVSYEEAKENYSYSWKESENKWKWTSFLTPGSKNIFDEDIEYPKGLYLSEILPNPESEEEKKEFIEIYNPLDKNVDLEKWALKDSSKTTKYVFPKDSEIGKKKYLVIYREDFKFALNNSGDEKVYLLNPNEETVSSVSYSDANEGVSYNYDGKNWRWSKDITPGKENKFNKLPKIEVDIDEDVYIGIYADFKVKVNDPEKEKIKVTWDFGDGHKSYKKETRHKYEKKGKYKLSVKIFDGSEEITKEYKVEVEKFPHREVKIRALCPNPTGDDSENEWILVKNYSDHSVNLKGWSVASGSKKLYNHPIYEDFEIKKGKTEKLTREDSNFTLNNEKSKVELRYPDGEVAYEVKYEKRGGAEENEVYEKGENGWQWILAQISQEELIDVETNNMNCVNDVVEEDFSGFLGGKSVNGAYQKDRGELLNYGTNIRLASVNYSEYGRVLGVSIEKDSPLVYKFTETILEENKILKFAKKVSSSINLFFNKTINFLISFL